MYQVVPGPAGDAGAEPTVIEAEADLLWAGLLLSFTVAVKAEVPVAVGIPEIVPEVAARVRPAGNLPALMDHV
jgi:hypothetical protein